MPTFLDLYSGTVAKITISVPVCETRATRTAPEVGIWTLDQEWFGKIADHIASVEANSTQKPFTPQQAAIKCDEVGIENRFFRMDSVVAQWLDETEPTLIVDYSI